MILTLLCGMYFVVVWSMFFHFLDNDYNKNIFEILVCSWLWPFYLVLFMLK